jgi:hypothetical protein
MEPEGSLPSWKRPITSLHPEPDQSSPYYPIQFLLSTRLISSIHPAYVLVLLVVSFLLVFTPISYMFFSLSISPLQLQFMLHAQSISFSSTWSLWYKFARSTSYEVPHYAVFSTLLSPHPSSVQILSSAPCSQAPSVFVPPLMSDTKFRTHTEPEAIL